jgi:lysozyme family protein
MSNFEKSIRYILAHEGGLCNDAADPGGLTNFGICQREYPNLDIRNLSEDDAIAIYRRDYWRPYMDMMPYTIAAKLFDCSVNMGHKQANVLLQRAVGVIDDGIIGHDSLMAINKDDPALLMRRFVSAIKRFYEVLIERKPALVKFKNGWNRRAEWIPPEAA